MLLLPVTASIPGTPSLLRGSPSDAGRWGIPQGWILHPPRRAPAHRSLPVPVLARGGTRHAAGGCPGCLLGTPSHSLWGGHSTGSSGHGGGSWELARGRKCPQVGRTARAPFLSPVFTEQHQHILRLLYSSRLDRVARCRRSGQRGWEIVTGCGRNCCYPGGNPTFALDSSA